MTGCGRFENLVQRIGYSLDVSATAPSADPNRLEPVLRERRTLLERSAETYIALADRLDDGIAALEAAQRVATLAQDVDVETPFDRAGRDASAD